MAEFFICRKCSSIVSLVEGSGKPVCCEGSEFEVLQAGTSDASREKHVPEVCADGDTITVSVGSVLHPATKAHHISWICLETKAGRQFKYLENEAEPKAVFKIADDTARRVYAYCNLHGLWVKEL